MKRVLFILIVLSIWATASADDCGRITLANNSSETVVGIVNGWLDGERCSYMGAELEAGEKFSGQHCYHYGDYDVLWIVPHKPNDIRPFVLNSNHITLYCIE